MTCNEGYSAKTKELCMRDDEDQFVTKLMDILLEMDSGISIYQKSFRDYGAADPFFITGQEIVAKMEPQGENQEYSAQ